MSMDSVPTPEKITQYAAYLKSQGVPDEKIQGYTKYLAEQHDVEHPAVKDSGWLGTVGEIAKDVAMVPIHAIQAVGDVMEKYSTAPSRSFVRAAQKGENPFSAFAGQFGEATSKAPTPKEIVKAAGVPDEKPVFSTSIKELQNIPTRSPILNAAQLISHFLPEETQKAKIAPTAADLASIPAGMAIDATNIIPAVGAVKSLSKVIRGTKAAETAAGVAKAVSSAVSDTAQGVKLSAEGYVAPRQAADFPKMVAIAEKHGIDPKLLPESVEFGPNSVQSTIGRHIREGQTGAADVQKFEQGYGQVQEALDKKIADISGGKPVSATQAGDVIREGYNNAVDRLFKQVDFTHNQVIDSVPGLQLDKASAGEIESTLTGLEKWAKGRVQRGFTATDREQGNQVLRAIDAVRNSNGSYKQAYETLTDIGKAAFNEIKPGTDIAPDQEKFQNLYFKMRDAMLGTVDRKLGADVGERLREGNALISDFMKDASYVKKAIQNDKVAPESAFRQLILNGDSNKINALKGMLTKEEFAQLKGAVLDTITKRNPDGTVPFRSFSTALNGKRNITEHLLQGSELQDLKEIAELGDRFGPVQLSTSRTGSSNILLNPVQGLKSAVANRATLERMKEQARGAQKWISNGAANIAQHSEEAKQVLDQVNIEDRGVQNLLMQASDLKPGSKAMDDILKQIKSRSK